MRVSELCEAFNFNQIHLHDGMDGKLVAKNRDSVKKYGDALVLTCYCKLDCGADGSFARPYVYAYISHVDVQNIRNGEQK